MNLMLALTAFVALVLSLILMQVAIALGTRFRMLVSARLYRNSRSKRKMSYLGGVAVAVATGAAALLINGVKLPTLATIGGGFVFLAVGFRNNHRRSKTPPALYGLLQIAAAAGVWWLTLRQVAPGLVGGILVVLLLVAVARSFNMIDNMNGVAGLTGAATGFGVMGLAILSGQSHIGVIPAAVFGTCMGFLPYNRGRAKVYLGAGGPEFLGFVLAVSVIRISAVFNSLPLALLATGVTFLVPLTDSCVALASRLALGRPMLQGATDHLSHRLARMGLSTKKAASLHALGALAASGAVALAMNRGAQPLLVAVDVALVVAFVLTILEERRVKIRRSARLAAMFLVAALVGLGLMSLPAALGAAKDLKSAQTAFNSAFASAKAEQFDAASTSFAEGGRLSAAAENKLNNSRTRPASFLPVLGDNLRTVTAIASGGKLIAHAAELALSAARTLAAGSGGKLAGFSEGRLEVQPWTEASQKITEAAKAARQALSGVQDTGGFLLPQVRDGRAAFLSQGEAAATSLEKASDVTYMIPRFFGADRPRTWFLAIQNPVELRATGGFLGAFGILTADGGKVELSRFDANTDLPNVPAPVAASEEFQKLYDRFGSRMEWRNSNMSPDFPSAARLISEMWKSGTGQKIDGVVAIDAVGLNELLKVVGPVEVAPFGQITADNFLRLSLNEAYIRFPIRGDRSDFLLQVGKEVWSRVLSGKVPDPQAILKPIGKLAASKRLQLWDPEVEERVQRLGIGGELHRESSSDYLMVVGQNAAGNKIDYYARREISYMVDLTDPKAVKGDLTVKIANQAPDKGLPKSIIGPFTTNEYAGLNRTYLSVYLSPVTAIVRSVLDGKETSLESNSEKGLAVASKFMEISSRKTSTLSVKTLGLLAEPGLYKLTVQHQPNLNPDKLNVEVKVPQGFEVRQMSKGMTRKGNLVGWSGVLDSEKQFFVRFSPSTGAGIGSALASG